MPQPTAPEAGCGRSRSPTGRLSVAGCAVGPGDDRAQSLHPVMERSRARQPASGEEGIVPGICASPQGADRRTRVQRVGRVAVDGDHEQVGHARRQLAHLGQDRRAVVGPVWRATEARDLDVEGPRRPERHGEIGSARAAVRLVRELDAAIGQQEPGRQQLGSDVAPRFVVARVPVLLPDLGGVGLDEGTEPGGAGQPRDQLGGRPVVRGEVEEIVRHSLDGGTGRRSRMHEVMLGRAVSLALPVAPRRTSCAGSTSASALLPPRHGIATPGACGKPRVMP